MLYKISAETNIAPRHTVSWQFVYITLQHAYLFNCPLTVTVTLAPVATLSALVTAVCCGCRRDNAERAG